MTEFFRINKDLLVNAQAIVSLAFETHTNLEDGFQMKTWKLTLSSGKEFVLDKTEAGALSRTLVDISNSKRAA